MDYEGVLPLTREWIEMAQTAVATAAATFSLLRGSGLKYRCACAFALKAKVLPLTREWIEIVWHFDRKSIEGRSPSYEGVD